MKTVIGLLLVAFLFVCTKSYGFTIPDDAKTKTTFVIEKDNSIEVSVLNYDVEKIVNVNVLVNYDYLHAISFNSCYLSNDTEINRKNYLFYLLDYNYRYKLTNFNSNCFAHKKPGWNYDYLIMKP